MLRTRIILGKEGNRYLAHPVWGIAKTLDIAEWMMVLCGWKKQPQEYPDLQWEVSEQDAGFAVAYDQRELYILNQPLILN